MSKIKNSAQSFDTVLVLGGAGLVGFQVCRQIADELHPQKIVVASLFRGDARDAAGRLEREFSSTQFIAEWGNIFVPTEIANVKPWEIGNSPKHRKAVLDATYGDFATAYEGNFLVQLIKRHRPDAVIDCVNTATGISYQNVAQGALKVMDQMDTVIEQMKEAAQGSEDDEPKAKGLVQDVEMLLMSLSMPQLTRHVAFVHTATREVGTRFLIKVGTMGTGGMGLNIPYTHGEAKPSQVLMSKNAVALGQTGLLLLMARTPGGPIVKEVKPAAMIGYKAVERKTPARGGKEFHEFEPQEQVVAPGDTVLETRCAEDAFVDLGKMHTTVVCTGENGDFARDEFAAITAPGQMEMITAEEVAHAVVLELRGSNSGHDVIAALDGAIQGPTYRGGSVRQMALQDLAQMEAKVKDHSVALGILGPPELTKLLFEARLICHTFGFSIDAILKAKDGEDKKNPERNRTAQEVVDGIIDYIKTDDGRALVRMATSIGVPVLMPDGTTIQRGPKINIPEQKGHTTAFGMADVQTRDSWVKKGWVDLREQNMQSWMERFEKMKRGRIQVYAQGSAAMTPQTFSTTENFEIGDIVAWIFNNNDEGRIK
ncbi:MAG: hypothetical protein ABIH21_05150 [Patescibacteria group bacterium]